LTATDSSAQDAVAPMTDPDPSAQPLQHPAFPSEQAYIRRADECRLEMIARATASDVFGADQFTEAQLRRLRAEEAAALAKTDVAVIGRIDLWSADNGDETWYIGPHLISDPNRPFGQRPNPLVVSWAAPVSEPFYTATPEDRQGVQLRRRFRTDGATLLAITDDLAEGEATVATIDDALLRELERNRDGSMREVVATIQRDQYGIISAPPSTTLVVQGAPGTGKTVVGLHRAAFLLYRAHTSRPEAKVLIVGPNPVFMDYVSSVLPSLGESQADQFAVSDFRDLRPAAAERMDAARVKADPRMAELLANAVAQSIRQPERDIALLHEGVKFSVPASLVASIIRGVAPWGTPTAFVANASEQTSPQRWPMRTALQIAMAKAALLSGGSSGSSPPRSEYGPGHPAENSFASC
jgi:DNA helicase IV